MCVKANHDRKASASQIEAYLEQLLKMIKDKLKVPKAIVCFVFRNNLSFPSSKVNFLKCGLLHYPGCESTDEHRTDLSHLLSERAVGEWREGAADVAPGSRVCEHPDQCLPESQGHSLPERLHQIPERRDRLGTQPRRPMSAGGAESDQRPPPNGPNRHL